jgi:hypothetical protein
MDAPGSAQAAWKEQTGCLRLEGKSSMGNKGKKFKYPENSIS